MGHRPAVKGGYFPVPPVDRRADLRAEMLSTMIEMGLPSEKHHHEVAQSQHELGTKFGTLVDDGRPRCRSTSTACTTSPTATARPRPSCRSRSTATTARACTCHQSIWKDGKPLFAGNGYADLSEMCLYYIGGIIKHAKALNAFTNPSTNSYKRLIPGFEAPVLLAYSARNRSASCRIPYVDQPEGQARRGALPGSDREPLPRLRGDAHGRPGRHQEQDPSRRPDGQGPLRPAAGGAERHPDGLRLAARGARARWTPTTTSCRRATCSPRTRSRATSS